MILIVVCRLHLCSDTVHASVTRGNNFKLVPQHCRYGLRKYYFTSRVILIWNSLPNDVVMADNINLFKKRLDKFWSSYDFVYLFKSSATWHQKCKIISFSVFLSFVYLNFLSLRRR